jgi:hypothetical protein
MSGYAIMRFVKHSGGAGGIEAHHERLKDSYKSNPDIHTSRSGRNIHLIQPEQRYGREIKARIDAARERNPKLSVKSNSVRFVDTLIAASPTYFFKMPDRMVREYFGTALKFFEEKVSAENIVSAVIHMDEKTSHMHLVFVPLTDDDRLSAKDIIGGPAGCRKWQDEFYAKMAKAFPDLLRGKPKSLTGRGHLPTQALKDMGDIENPDRKYAMVTELRALQKFVASIPDHLKKEIADLAKQAKRDKAPERERTR